MNNKITSTNLGLNPSNINNQDVQNASDDTEAKACVQKIDDIWQNRTQISEYSNLKKRKPHFWQRLKKDSNRSLRFKFISPEDGVHPLKITIKPKHGYIELKLSRRKIARNDPKIIFASFKNVFEKHSFKIAQDTVSNTPLFTSKIEKHNVLRTLENPDNNPLLHIMKNIALFYNEKDSTDFIPKILASFSVSADAILAPENNYSPNINETNSPLFTFTNTEKDKVIEKDATSKDKTITSEVPKTPQWTKLEDLSISINEPTKSKQTTEQKATPEQKQTPEQKATPVTPSITVSTEQEVMEPLQPIVSKTYYMKKTDETLTLPPSSIPTQLPTTPSFTATVPVTPTTKTPTTTVSPLSHIVSAQDTLFTPTPPQYSTTDNIKMTSLFPRVIQKHMPKSDSQKEIELLLSALDGKTLPKSLYPLAKENILECARIHLITQHNYDNKTVRIIEQSIEKTNIFSLLTADNTIPKISIPNNIPDEYVSTLIDTINHIRVHHAHVPLLSLLYYTKNLHSSIDEQNLNQLLTQFSLERDPSYPQTQIIWNYFSHQEKLAIFQDAQLALSQQIVSQKTQQSISHFINFIKKHDPLLVQPDSPMLDKKSKLIGTPIPQNILSNALQSVVECSFAILMKDGMNKKTISPLLKNKPVLKTIEELLTQQSTESLHIHDLQPIPENCIPAVLDAINIARNNHGIIPLLAFIYHVGTHTTTKPSKKDMLALDTFYQQFIAEYQEALAIQKDHLEVQDGQMYTATIKAWKNLSANMQQTITNTLNDTSLHSLLGTSSLNYISALQNVIIETVQKSSQMQSLVELKGLPINEEQLQEAIDAVLLSLILYLSKKASYNDQKVQEISEFIVHNNLLHSLLNEPVGKHTLSDIFLTLDANTVKTIVYFTNLARTQEFSMLISTLPLLYYITAYNKKDLTNEETILCSQLFEAFYKERESQVSTEISEIWNTIPTNLQQSIINASSYIVKNTTHLQLCQDLIQWIQDLSSTLPQTIDPTPITSTIPTTEITQSLGPLSGQPKSEFTCDLFSDAVISYFKILLANPPISMKQESIVEIVEALSLESLIDEILLKSEGDTFSFNMPEYSTEITTALTLAINEGRSDEPHTLLLPLLYHVEAVTQEWNINEITKQECNAIIQSFCTEYLNNIQTRILCTNLSEIGNHVLRKAMYHCYSPNVLSNSTSDLISQLKDFLPIPINTTPDLTDITSTSGQDTYSYSLMITGNAFTEEEVIEFAPLASDYIIAHCYSNNIEDESIKILQKKLNADFMTDLLITPTDENNPIITVAHDVALDESELEIIQTCISRFRNEIANENNIYSILANIVYDKESTKYNNFLENMTMLQEEGFIHSFEPISLSPEHNPIPQILDYKDINDVNNLSLYFSNLNFVVKNAVVDTLKHITQSRLFSSKTTEYFTLLKDTLSLENTAPTKEERDAMQQDSTLTTSLTLNTTPAIPQENDVTSLAHSTYSYLMLLLEEENNLSIVPHIAQTTFNLQNVYDALISEETPFLIENVHPFLVENDFSNKIQHAIESCRTQPDKIDVFPIQLILLQNPSQEEQSIFIQVIDDIHSAILTNPDNIDITALSEYLQNTLTPEQEQELKNTLLYLNNRTYLQDITLNIISNTLMALDAIPSFESFTIEIQDNPLDKESAEAIAPFIQANILGSVEPFCKNTTEFQLMQSVFSQEFLLEALTTSSPSLTFFAPSQLNTLPIDLISFLIEVLSEVRNQQIGTDALIIETIVNRIFYCYKEKGVDSEWTQEITEKLKQAIDNDLTDTSLSFTQTISFIQECNPSDQNMMQSFFVDFTEKEYLPIEIKDLLDNMIASVFLDVQPVLPQTYKQISLSNSKIPLLSFNPSITDIINIKQAFLTYALFSVSSEQAQEQYNLLSSDIIMDLLYNTSDPIELVIPENLNETLLSNFYLNTISAIQNNPAILPILPVASEIELLSAVEQESYPRLYEQFLCPLWKENVTQADLLKAFIYWNNIFLEEQTTIKKAILNIIQLEQNPLLKNLTILANNTLSFIASFEEGNIPTEKLYSQTINFNKCEGEPFVISTPEEYESLLKTLKTMLTLISKDKTEVNNVLESIEPFSLFSLFTENPTEMLCTSSITDHNTYVEMLLLISLMRAKKDIVPLLPILVTVDLKSENCKDPCIAFLTKLMNQYQDNTLEQSNELFNFFYNTGIIPNDLQLLILQAIMQIESYSQHTSQETTDIITAFKSNFYRGFTQYNYTFNINSSPPATNCNRNDLIQFAKLYLYYFITLESSSEEQSVECHMLNAVPFEELLFADQNSSVSFSLPFQASDKIIKTLDDLIRTLRIESANPFLSIMTAIVDYSCETEYPENIRKTLTECIQNAWLCYDKDNQTKSMSLYQYIFGLPSNIMKPLKTFIENVTSISSFECNLEMCNFIKFLSETIDSIRKSTIHNGFTNILEHNNPINTQKHLFLSNIKGLDTTNTPVLDMMTNLVTDLYTYNIYKNNGNIETTNNNVMNIIPTSIKGALLAKDMGTLYKLEFYNNDLAVPTVPVMKEVINFARTVDDQYTLFTKLFENIFNSNNINLSLQNKFMQIINVVIAELNNNGHIGNIQKHLALLNQEEALLLHSILMNTPHTLFTPITRNFIYSIADVLSQYYPSIQFFPISSDITVTGEPLSFNDANAISGLISDILSNKVSYYKHSLSEQELSYFTALVQKDSIQKYLVAQHNTMLPLLSNNLPKRSQLHALQDITLTIQDVIQKGRTNHKSLLLLHLSQILAHHTIQTLPLSSNETVYIQQIMSLFSKIGKELSTKQKLSENVLLSMLQECEMSSELFIAMRDTMNTNKELTVYEPINNLLETICLAFNSINITTKELSLPQQNIKSKALIDANLESHTMELYKILLEVNNLPAKQIEDICALIPKNIFQQIANTNTMHSKLNFYNNEFNEDEQNLFLDSLLKTYTHLNFQEQVLSFLDCVATLLDNSFIELYPNFTEEHKKQIHKVLSTYSKLHLEIFQGQKDYITDMLHSEYNDLTSEQQQCILFILSVLETRTLPSQFAFYIDNFRQTLNIAPSLKKSVSDDTILNALNEYFTAYANITAISDECKHYLQNELTLNTLRTMLVATNQDQVILHTNDMLQSKPDELNAMKNKLFNTTKEMQSMTHSTSLEFALLLKFMESFNDIYTKTTEEKNLVTAFFTTIQQQYSQLQITENTSELELNSMLINTITEIFKPLESADKYILQIFITFLNKNINLMPPCVKNLFVQIKNTMIPSLALKTPSASNILRHFDNVKRPNGCYIHPALATLIPLIKSTPEKERSPLINNIVKGNIDYETITRQLRTGTDYGSPSSALLYLISCLKQENYQKYVTMDIDTLYQDKSPTQRIYKDVAFFEQRLDQGIYMIEKNHYPDISNEYVELFSQGDILKIFEKLESPAFFTLAIERSDRPKTNNDFILNDIINNHILTKKDSAGKDCTLHLNSIVLYSETAKHYVTLVKNNEDQWIIHSSTLDRNTLPNIIPCNTLQDAIDTIPNLADNFIATHCTYISSEMNDMINKDK